MQRRRTSFITRNVLPSNSAARAIIERYRPALRTIQEAGLLQGVRVLWLAGGDPEIVEALEAWLKPRAEDRARAEFDKTAVWHIPEGVGHPAEGQRGLKARRSIEASSIVGEYIGIYKTFPEKNGGQQDYAFGFSIVPYDTGGLFNRVTLKYLALDASAVGLRMHLINDFRGVDAEPNVASVEVWELTQNLPRIFIVATRRIQIGEELLLDYGEAYWGGIEASIAALRI